MNLLDVVARRLPPGPWEEGEKIPWDDRAFSERMLEVHLSQENDWASRRTAVIEQQVNWIEQHFLGPRSRVLDLGCGPGLYTHLLAQLGHDCVGLDIGPASIDYARERAREGGVSARYELADIRETDFGEGFDLVTSIFGEFNVFRPEDARLILRKARSALRSGGHILVECHTHEEVKRQGNSPPSWHTSEHGLFADYPHAWLEEHFWDESSGAATTRYMIVDARDGGVALYASTMQAYTDEQFEALLVQAGFGDVRRFGSLGESGAEFEGRLQAFAGRRAEDSAKSARR